MDPDQFRKARIKINQLCETIRTLADENNAELSKKKLVQSSALLEDLIPQAEGEIQKRSVKNLGIRINGVSALIDKIKIPKKKAARSKNAAPEQIIDWNEAHLSSLSENYLSKVLTNMETGSDSQVCFSTTGKGIRASYQVAFGDGKSSAFSGSSHKPLKKKLSNSAQKISQPFSLEYIKSIVKQK